MTETKLLTPKEAAKFLHVTPESLQYWRSTGKYSLPFVKVGSNVMYNQKDLDEWVDKRTTTTAVLGGDLKKEEG